MNEVIGKGAVLVIGEGSGSTVTVQLVSCSGPTVTAPEVKAVHTGSEHVRYRAGIKDIGEFTFKGLYSSEDADTLLSLVGVDYTAHSLTLEDGTYVTFDGFIKEHTLGEVAAEGGSAIEIEGKTRLQSIPVYGEGA